MLPTSNPRPVARERRLGAAEPVVFDQASSGVEASSSADRDPLHPIGPERLAALREAIRDGSYPTDADVMGGLERMLARDENS